MISFIVSAYNHPEKLICCLASLAIQIPEPDLWVADNSDTPEMVEACESVCSVFGARRVQTHAETSLCYISSEHVAEMVSGEWLCFPSDDSYYVPGFSKLMLDAAEENGWDFVYCDALYDPRMGGEYSVMTTRPACCAIDKTTFILRRELFQGFPPHESDWRDGALAESLVERGVKHGKPRGILVVHN